MNQCTQTCNQGRTCTCAHATNQDLLRASEQAANCLLNCTIALKNHDDRRAEVVREYYDALKNAIIKAKGGAA